MSDIDDKLAGFTLAQDLTGAGGLTPSAIDILKGASGLDEAMGLASAAAGIRSIADPFVGRHLTRDLQGISGLTPSAIDILKGAHGLDEGAGLARAAAGLSSIADQAAAGLGTDRILAAARGSLASAIDTRTGIHGFDKDIGRAANDTIVDQVRGPNTDRVLAAASGSAVSAIDALKGFRDLDESMRLASGAADTHSAMSKLARQISDQQSAIAALRPLIPEMPRFEMPSLEVPRFVLPELSALEINIPPNPLYETNERLASIEQRFDRMESIALNGAEIATGLQASAATFLMKFEKASADNDRTSSRAIWLGIIAVLIAITMPVAQVLYTELWRAPADSASQQAAIADMKGQMKGLEDAQRTAADELAKVLSSGNSEMNAALRDIRNLLIEQQKRPIVPPEMKR